MKNEATKWASKMRWQKVGCIFPPMPIASWSAGYAAVPIADPIDDDYVRVYFTARDKDQRSHTGWFVLRMGDFKVQEVSERPVLVPGVPGTFDDSGAMGSWLVKHNGAELFHYIGWNRGVTVPFRNSLGLAIREPGSKEFKKLPGPILDRSVFDPCFVSNAAVLREADKWRMYYISCVRWEIPASGVPRHHYHLKYAESSDGLRWTANGKIVIDFKDAGEYAISRPSVLRDGALYKLWYSHRGQSYRIGYAESTDGENWSRQDERVGIDVSASGWDSTMIEYPYVFDHKGRRYMLYNGNDYGKTGIGLAILEG